MDKAIPCKYFGNEKNNSFNLKFMKSEIEGTGLSPQTVKSMSYTDFVGLVNQWNVLPGSYVSLNKWKIFADITKKSYILEVACTTGFSSRELSLMTGCKGVAFDISEPSIKRANYNKKMFAKQIKINYEVADGYQYNHDKKFSHIIVGASLRFFPDPAAMLDRLIGMLHDSGYILATEFYVDNKIPPTLIKEAQQVFNITPTTVGYKDVMKIYNGLEIVYEDRNIPVLETEQEIDYYTSCTIERAKKILDITDSTVLNAMYERLKLIKITSNKLREYQKYNVLVLRYRKNLYPNRYVELF